jgi:hypothetical protein
MSIHVYWLGIVGIPGKGPNWSEPYNGNKTLGDITREMKASGFGERNKEIKMFKFKPGNLNVYDKNSPHWSDDTKLSEYASYYGGIRGGRLEMIYVMV